MSWTEQRTETKDQYIVFSPNNQIGSPNKTVPTYLLHDLQGTDPPDLGDFSFHLSLFAGVLPACLAGYGVATWVVPFLPPARGIHVTNYKFIARVPWQKDYLTP